MWSQHAKAGRPWTTDDTLAFGENTGRFFGEFGHSEIQAAAGLLRRLEIGCIYMPGQTVGVVGGARMGSGIARVSSRSRSRTIVMEPSQRYPDAAQHRFRQSLVHALERKKLTDSGVAEIRDRVHFTTRPQDLRLCANRK